MNRRIAISTFALALVFTSCTDSAELLPGDPNFNRDPALDINNRSASGESRSHNMGENCMMCHQQLGPGIGKFTLASTIYDSKGVPAVNATLELYDKPPAAGGTLVKRLQGDALGNVFTTDPLPFPDAPLFPVVISANGVERNAMPFPTISGACNQCHRPDKRVQVLPPSAL